LVRIVCAVIVSCLLVLCEPIAANAAIPTTERDALIALYLSANGNTWTNNTNWCAGTCPASGTPMFAAAGTECNSWYGVACDAAQTHVTAINLKNNHLTGQVPALAGFTRLQIFDAGINQLTGKIPDLTGLTNLQGFSVQNNHLTGPIPTLARLTNLRVFDAGINQLTGEIPDLTGLTRLHGFSVHDNHLTGPIPALAGLTNLKVFDVSYNQLMGKIPDLAELTSLQAFAVSDNQLSGSVPAAPASLTHASLCPNPLAIAPQPDIDPAWNKATGATPWWTKSLFSDTCGSVRTPPGTTAARQTPAEVQPDLDDRRLALKASLAATGNDYPTPALFVKRWNLITQWAPEAQITKFTSRGHENDPRPTSDLDGFDFVGAEITHLQIGSSGKSIEYVTTREDPLNIGAKQRRNSYSITISGDQKRAIGQLCVLVISSTRSSFTSRSAIQLLSDAVHYVPPSNATDSRKHAEAEGVSLTVRHGENETCEVEETD
jgi:hypothetical protein